ncbi:hypothetical protein J8281_16680 [Aquimarina sp. U1-2]|uniref:DUF4175 family protein n=1 Tax=Aquimarina sp. U1-2 TaxID=2823141 RepID=UPI001AECAE1F|nr:DUF4175 family protein [Aquimarina sp. U1-2]MBP2833833.1 hypothetical protein [Aquimarina sp. U1-2]
MSNFEYIKVELEKFIRRYYSNELIKGAILFFAIGALYFLVTMLIENFLWLGKLGRTFLFWLFVAVEAGLFIKFILLPITKLLKLTKGIGFDEASKIIGNHFPEVNDKLLNLLQLHQKEFSSDLLLASIEQKSSQLRPVPFKVAINFRKNFKYVKYAAIPALLFLLLFIFNKTNWISDSYKRVVNYQVAYAPPAPFQFFLLNDVLNVYEDRDFLLRVNVSGEIIPESVTIAYNDEVYFMRNIGQGNFEYTFNQPKTSTTFMLEANGIQSIPYTLSVVPVPTLLNFEMNLDYPAYTKKRDERLQGSGNAVIPEGTKVTWNVRTKNTDRVEIRAKDSLYKFSKNQDIFTKDVRVYSNMEYEITTSNRAIQNYDNLAFNLNVIRDQFPEMRIQSERDSISEQTLYFYGRVSDDYGLSKLRLVYYDVNDISSKRYERIPINQTNFDEFVYTFPSTQELTPGVTYAMYFEIFDNDVIHNYKSTKSEVFDFRRLTKKELENALLQKQNEAISGLNTSLEKFKKQEEALKSLSKLQKEKRRLDFNDKKKLDEFLEKQKQQEKMMQDFTKKLKDNLEQLDKNEEKEPFKDALKERLERNEERLKKNEKLLEELDRLADKIQKEELTEKLEELGKENKNIKKNLERLLELTKRYYVIEKHEKLAEALENLADKQEQLSKKEDNENSKKNQDELNKEFQNFQKEMEELRNENEKLKKPMDLDQDKNEEEEIKEEQEKASDNLEQQKNTEAKKNQKSAAQKMKQMSQGMQMQMQMSGAEQQTEDMQMLRQILDNLVDFSFEQEDLMAGFKKINKDNPSYSNKLKRQSVLRENFIHIDDSLYALAMRTPQITEDVTKKLTDIEFNIDKSLERLAENQILQGAANQQYTVTGANDLAYLLSQTLEQMQNSMSASGKGKSGSSQNEFQLPDIIKKQEELNEKMKEGSEKGKKPGEKKRDQKGEGQGKDGEQGEQKNGEKNGKGGSKNGKDKGNNQGKGAQENDGEKENDINEDLNGELYEIYKQQQQLRNALENKIKEQGVKNELGSTLLDEMKRVEQALLENGFDQSTLSRMIELKHKLLKLEEASLQQDEDDKRESATNKKSFESNAAERIKAAKQYFNTTEILNRQVLPLRQNHKRKVQEYFKKNND